MKNQIVHISLMEKFIPPFIDFIEDNLNSTYHKYIILGRKRLNYGLSEKHDILWIDSILKIPKLLTSINTSEKIIIHGLWSESINLILFLQPWLLKKCYHVMWGGDFYFPEQQSWIKKSLLKRIGHFITYIKGDYELAKKWYGVNGVYHECFMYPSNLYKEYDIKPKEHNATNIQLGNSADPTNNHIEVLEKLKVYKDANIKIFTPLSYGDQKYAKEVISKGQQIFGDKFVALTEFMPFEKYLDFLGGIDMAIFAHKRQQAMGNIITLLGLGKKVYMRNDITPWNLFKDIEVKVFDLDNVEIDLIEEKIKKENQQKIKEYFSQENYLKQLQNLFESN